jgi:hypothetical protein
MELKSGFGSFSPICVCNDDEVMRFDIVCWAWRVEGYKSFIKVVRTFREIRLKLKGISKNLDTNPKESQQKSK